MRNCELPEIQHFSASSSPGSPGHVSAGASQTKFPQARPAPRLISSQHSLQRLQLCYHRLCPQRAQARYGFIGSATSCLTPGSAPPIVPCLIGWHFLSTPMVVAGRRSRNCSRRTLPLISNGTGCKSRSQRVPLNSSIWFLHDQSDRCTVQVAWVSPEACRAGLRLF